MDTKDNFLIPIFNDFVSSMDTYAFKMINVISGDFSMYARALVALYCLYFGYSLMQGKFDKGNEIITSIILVIGLHAMIIETELYFKLLKGYVDFTMNLAGYFVAVGKDTAGAENGLQMLFNNFGPILKSTIGLLTSGSGDEHGLIDTLKMLPMRLMALIALILVIVIFVIYFSLCLMSIFGIYLLFIIGAVPIYFAAFKETRHIFFTWFKAVLCDGMIIVIASVFLAVCINGLDTTIKDFLSDFKTDGSVLSFGYITMVIYCAVTCGILLKAPDYASNLTGSSSGSSAMIAGGIAMTTGRMIKAGVASPGQAIGAAKTGYGVAKSGAKIISKNAMKFLDGKF